MSTRGIAALTCAACLLFSGCSSKPGSLTVKQSSGSEQVIGAGSTFVYPVMSRWIEDYQRNHPGVQINYQSIGSGGGIRQLRSIAPMAAALATYSLASFCSKTVKRAVVAGENAQSRQSVFRWRRTAPFQKITYMRPEWLLSRGAETCRHTSCMAVSKVCLRNPEKLGCSLVGAVPTSLCFSQQSSQAEQIVGQHRCSH